MIINRKKLNKTKAIQFLTAVLLGGILLTLIGFFRPAFPWYWTVVVEVICGMLLAVTLALCINEETRNLGILLSVFLIFAPVLAIVGGITLGILVLSYGLGIGIGLIYDLLVLRKAYFELLDFAVSKLVEVLIFVIALIFIVFSFGKQVLSFVFSLINGFGTSSLMYMFQDYFIMPELLIWDLVVPFIIPVILLCLLYPLLRFLGVTKTKITKPWIVCLFAVSSIVLAYPYLLNVSINFATVVVLCVCSSSALGSICLYQALKKVPIFVQKIYSNVITALFALVELSLVSLAVYILYYIVNESGAIVISSIVHYTVYYVSYFIIPVILLTVGIFYLFSSLSQIISESVNSWDNIKSRFKQNNNVFIIGPPKSGKTTFGLGFLYYLQRHKMKPDCKSDIENEVFDFETALQHFRTTGEMPDRTTYNVQGTNQFQGITTYIFNLLKYGIIPVKWRLVDYPGESYKIFASYGDSISKNVDGMEKTTTQYESDLAVIAEKLGRLENGKPFSNSDRDKLIYDILSSNLVKKTIKDKSFVEILEKEGEFSAKFTHVIIYTYFQHSGKLVFMIDGEKVIAEKGTAAYKDHKECMEVYNDIINSLKVERDTDEDDNVQISKKIAFVVTKSDLLFNLYKNSDYLKELYVKNNLRTKDIEYIERLDQLKQDEQEGFTEFLMTEILEPYTSLFSLLHNQKLPVYFIAESLDTFATDNIPGHRIANDKYGFKLYGFDEIVKFGK